MLDLTSPMLFHYNLFWISQKNTPSRGYHEQNHLSNSNTVASQNDLIYLWTGVEETNCRYDWETISDLNRSSQGCEHLVFRRPFLINLMSSVVKIVLIPAWRPQRAEDLENTMTRKYSGSVPYHCYQHYSSWKFRSPNQAHVLLNLLFKRVMKITNEVSINIFSLETISIFWLR